MTTSTSSTDFGRVENDGTVLVKMPDGSEKQVGQWAAGDPNDGLAFYIRKYHEIENELSLALQRLKEGKGNADAVFKLIERVKTSLETPNFVGDLSILSTKIEELQVLAAVKKAEFSAAKAIAKEKAMEKRKHLVEEAEKLINSKQWKVTTQRFKEIVEEWKKLPHGAKSEEQVLWKRFSAARSAFDKTRRQYFSTLESGRKEASKIKSEIVTQAKAIADSKDWNDTANKFRNLMVKWKSAPILERKEEQKLWKEFKLAQDVFFAARTAALSVLDEEHTKNLEAKKVLAEKAEKILPITDIKSARQALKPIQEEWSKIGHVSRKDKDKIEARLKAVEEAIRNAEKNELTRTDPAKSARAQSTMELIEAKLIKTEKERESALSLGDTKKAEKLALTIESQKMLLEATKTALAEFTR
jgi:ElaB/YqjD/DUF883 family membrane-anchored ribosome-binding protein